MGMTYQADRLDPNGDIIQSAIDHIYKSTSLEKCSLTRKLPNSSTDHVPIIAEIWRPEKIRVKTRTVTKRSLKRYCV